MNRLLFAAAIGVATLRGSTAQPPEDSYLGSIVDVSEPIHCHGPVKVFTSCAFDGKAKNYEKKDGLTMVRLGSTVHGLEVPENCVVNAYSKAVSNDGMFSSDRNSRGIIIKGPKRVCVSKSLQHVEVLTIEDAADAAMVSKHVAKKHALLVNQMTRLNRRLIHEVENLKADLTQLKGTKLISGPKGEKGPQGLRAFSGERGTTGSTGARGLTGATGIAGEDGPRGPQGVVGNAITGSTGATGETGATGDDGEEGMTGLPGTTGATGTETGATGNTGATGPSTTLHHFKVVEKVKVVENIVGKHKKTTSPTPKAVEETTKAAREEAALERKKVGKRASVDDFLPKTDPVKEAKDAETLKAAKALLKDISISEESVRKKGGRVESTAPIIASKRRL